jgi:glycosyltransferase involved in cell wall biosynthesis
VVALWSGSAALITSEFGVASSRIAVVPNAVPAERFAPRDADERAATRTRLGLRDTFTVVYVGALAPEKGPDVAVAAVARVEDAQLLVVGDGPERATLEQQAQDEAHGRVVFTGSIADPTDAYVAADVVVLPSRGGDSMPAVLIEAGLMERASVSTPVEAIPELVVDGVTGRIVPVGSVDGLAAALTELRDDPAGTAQLGCAARARCLERYSMPVVARQWSDLLTRVANARRRSSP